MPAKRRRKKAASSAKKTTRRKTARKTTKRKAAKRTTRRRKTAKTAAKKTPRVDDLKKVMKLNKGYFMKSDKFRGIEKTEVKKLGAELYLVEKTVNNEFIATLLLNHAITSDKRTFSSLDELSKALK